MKYSIKGWVKNSFCDWDAKISSVVFLPGCNMMCPFCQNWQLVKEHRTIEDIDWDMIRDYLSENKDFIDGIVITGGEPFISDFLLDMIKEVKQMSIAVKVDTNGTFPDKLKYLIENSMIDGVAMDIKNAFEPALYSSTCGVPVDDEMLGNILSSARILIDSGIDYEFRTTLAPTIHTKDDVKQICQTIQGCRKYVIQNFRGETETINPAFTHVKPFKQQELEDILLMTRKIIPNTILK
ncbi:MAG: anaerobic ribonucleoside-triphosphate reductase activating protein [Candidatus Omnitrophica bacterium]|nr:anaerobic ribonucleoside-triphosphate reductase activating protein [Candidatus Omnitrophota bacterium]